MTDVRPINASIAGRELEVVADAVNEQMIIASALAGWDDGVADRLLRIFGPDHFLAPEHAAFWGIVREMRARKLGWNPITARTIGGGTFDDNLMTLVEQIGEAHPFVPENLDFHVEQMLWDRSKATALTGPITALLDAIKDPKSEPERIHALSRQIPAALKSGERKHLLDPKQLVHSQIAQIRARRDQNRRFVFGIDGLDYFESHEAAKIAGIVEPENIAGSDGRVRRMLPGAEPGYITLISTQSGGGKALALDTPIATPSVIVPGAISWTTMGAINVGDEVFGEDGLPCHVLHCSSVLRDRDCYRVGFSDGSSIVADADHLWQTKVGDVASVKTTLEIANSIDAPHVIMGMRPGDRSRVFWCITSVAKVPSVPVRCIMVDSPSHLYLAGRAMIPTHNTTLATALTLAFVRMKRRVLYCAWEPKAGITLESLAVQSLRWSRTRVLQGQVTDQELLELEARMAVIAKYVRFMTKEPFYDFGGGKKKRTNEQNLDIFAAYVADSGCDAVVADLWKYCLVSQKPEEEEEALKRQQAMCEDLRFHLFLLQQQTHKRFDMRSDKRPSREGVKGSGTYLEIVDNFLAPNIPSLWKPGIPVDRFEVFVLKQRYGRWPIGIEFKWDADSGAISGGTTIPYDFDAKDRGVDDNKGKNSKTWSSKPPTSVSMGVRSGDVPVDGKFHTLIKGEAEEETPPPTTQMTVPRREKIGTIADEPVPAPAPGRVKVSGKGIAPAVVPIQRTKVSGKGIDPPAGEF